VDLTRSHVHRYRDLVTNTRIARKAGRQLILIDIENLTGTPSPTCEEVETAKAALRQVGSRT